MLIGDVQRAIQANHYLANKHANKAARDDGLDVADIWLALCQPDAVLVEDNPRDTRGPCAVFYCEVRKRPVHAVIAYPSTVGAQRLGLPELAFMITCYRPDNPQYQGKWSADYKKRI